MKATPETKFKICFELMAYLGLRVSEAVRVNVADIDLNKSQIRVWNAKTREWQYMNMPPAAYMALSEYLKRYGDKINERGGFLVHNNLKNPKNGRVYLNEGTVRRGLAAILKEVGLDDHYKEIPTNGYQQGERRKLRRLSSHSFRHHFGAKVYEESGGDIVMTCKIMRHKRIDTTMVYLESVNKKLKEGITNAFPDRVDSSKEGRHTMKSADMDEFVKVFRLYQQMKAGKMGAL